MILFLSTSHTLGSGNEGKGQCIVDSSQGSSWSWFEAWNPHNDPMTTVQVAVPVTAHPCNVVP